MRKEELDELMKKVTREDPRRQLGKISSVRICHWRDEDAPPNTVWVQIDFNGGSSTQGFGGLALNADGIRSFVSGLCDACGVKDQERLVGREVYALRAFNTWGANIVGLEDKQTGRRFTVRGFRRAMGYGDESELQAELKRIDSSIAHLTRRLQEEKARRVDLTAGNGYAEWG